MGFQAYATEILKDTAFVAPGATAHWWVQYFDNPLNTVLITLTIVLVALRIYYIVKHDGKESG